MNRKNESCINLVVFLILILAVPSYAADPDLDWKTLKSDHFRIHFHEGEQALAEKVAFLCENTHARLSVTFSWEPENRTDVVLSDEMDFPSGSATYFPFNQMNLFVIPTDKLSFLSDADTYLEVLILHEYTHILHLDKAEGKTAFLRNIFGRHFLLFPNNFQPTWFIEGLATYIETDHEKGIGRGENSWFQMRMRMEVAKGSMPVREINIAPLSPPYLYGEHFYEFIAETYGPEKISTMIETYSNNLIPYCINSNAKGVFGKNITELWNEFQIYLKNRYQPQLDRIRGQKIVKGIRIADAGGRYVSIKGYFDGAVQAMEDGSLYYVKNFDQQHQTLMLIKPDGTSEEIAELRSNARIDVHPEAGILIAQPEVCREYRIYFDLYKIVPGKKKLRRLTSCSRYRWAAWNPYGNQIAAVKTNLAKSELHLLDAEGEFLEKLWEGRAGETVAHVDWSPDGSRIVAACSFNGTGWNLWEFHIKEKRWHAITRDRDIEVYPRYAPDGNSLLFCSDHSGVYNLRKRNLATGDTVTLTNVEGGAFQPTQGKTNGDIYYLGYGTEGFNIYQLPAPQKDLPMPEEKPLKKEGQALMPADSDTAYDIHSYYPWPGILPQSWSPYAEFTEDARSAGIFIHGNDALDIYRYGLTLAYDIDNDDLVGAFSAGYRRLNLYTSRYNKVYRYSTGDHHIRQKKLYQATVYIPWTSIDSAWKIHFGLSAEIEADHEIRADQAQWADARDNLYGTALTFDNSKYYLYSVSLNEGRKIRLIAESSDFWDSDFSGEIYTIDWREYLPLYGKHVLAIRIVQGWGTEEPKPFELGGEGGTDFASAMFYYMDDPLFHHREYPLRGYPEGLAGLRGRRMQLGSLEWRFPLVEIRKSLMVPPLGLHQLAGILFVDTGSAWDHNGMPNEYYTGSGIELIADVAVFYRMNIRTRLGFAHGFDDDGENRWYMSLGSAF